jgi:O-antigen/teichoic acid export membrane protein
VLRNGFYNTAGAVISMVLLLVAIPLMIRLIGIEDYGLWILVTAIVGIVGLAEAGLSVSTTVFLARDLANRDAIGISQTLTVTVGAMLIIATGAGVALWAGAPLIVQLFPKMEESQKQIAVQALQVGALVVWFRLMQQIMVGVLQAHRRYDLVNAVTTGHTALLSVGLLVVAWLNGRIVEMMLWQAVIALFALIVLTLVALRLLSGFKLRPSLNVTHGASLARYSIMTWLVSLSGVLFSQFDKVIVGGILGTSVLGIYGAMTSVTSRINSLSAAPVHPLLPELSGLSSRSNNDRGAIETQVQQASRFNAVIALAMGGLLFVLTSVVLRVILPGSPPMEHISAFRLATVIYALYSLNAVGYYTLLVNDVKLCMVIQLASAGMALALITLGANSAGLVGAIGGNAGYLGILLLTYFGMKRLNTTMWRWASWLVVPFAWFFGIVVVALVLPEQVVIKALISAVGVLFLGLWWLSIHNVNLWMLLGRLRPKRHHSV